MALYWHRIACCVLFALVALPLAAAGDDARDIAEGSLGDPPGTVDLAPEVDPAQDVELLDYDPLFDDEPAELEAYDPWEPGNRAIYAFNRRVSKLVWDPITTGYRFVVPAPARRAVRRLVINLNAPIYAANHLLQLDPLAAAETLGAFSMNITFGVGGLFDTASGVGFSLGPTDFGQTLAMAGVGSGAYLMFPFLGPTTVRDGIGFVVDRGFHPVTYIFGLPVQVVGYGGVGFTALEEARDDLNALEESALDPYVVLRSAYLQARAGSIQAMRAPAPEPAAPEIEAMRAPAPEPAAPEDPDLCSGPASVASGGRAQL
ncbi:MAG: VacJ family lipoprotein [Deltaproteobacteria bacterium]|nr:VacJ family lipoprotein [Deltaproteobacteria bacterium]MBW2359498.1 VacJ family lipoprotein [Deltaproteobacteria bacterium]